MTLESLPADAGRDEGLIVVYWVNLEGFFLEGSGLLADVASSSRKRPLTGVAELEFSGRRHQVL
jgi:hypothetical protein